MFTTMTIPRWRAIGMCSSLHLPPDDKYGEPRSITHAQNQTACLYRRGDVIHADMIVRDTSDCWCWCCWCYRRDDEAIFTCDEVASLSFGAARRFRVFHPEGGLAFDEPLHHGDLVIFPRMWEHEVLPGNIPPKVRATKNSSEDWDAEGPLLAPPQASVRVNLTFRQV